MRRLPSSLCAILFGIATVAMPQSSLAQAFCPLAWQPGEAVPGIDGIAYAMATWDPDGVGPQPELVVVGGQFSVAGDQFANNVALYDPTLQRWSALGAGVGERVTSVCVRGSAASSPLVVGTNSGVRAWNGTTWQALGPNFNNAVNHVVELANGDLVAGGTFGLVGGSAINSLARWDGSQWQALGNPSTSSSIGSILGLGVLPNGDLVAGGSFTQIGGVACNHVARWDGTTWHALGAGSTTPVYGLVATAAGDVLAMGAFGVGTGSAARWNGASWVAASPSEPVGAIPVQAIGSNGVLFRTNVALWVEDAAGWNTVASWTVGVDVRDAVVLANGDVVLGGGFQVFAGEQAKSVVHRRNGVFTATAAGAVGAVHAASPTPDGGYLLGGSFRTSTMPATTLAHFDGVTWTPLAVPGTVVTDLVVRDDGSALLAGVFPVGSTLVPSLMRWQNGIATLVSLPAATFVSNLAEGRGATYVATISNGAVGVSRWDGTFLVPMPFAAFGALSDVVAMPNGDLVLAGSFQIPTARLLRWDGHQLQAIPGAPSGVSTLAVAANGDLLVGGELTAPFASIARWDGATWHALGALPTNSALRIDTLPNGDIVLAQRLNTVPLTTRIQRWDGQQWTVLGEARGSARVVWSPAGELAAFGDFTRVDSTVAALFTRLQSSCGATVQDLGGGCSGSAGLLTTRVDERAWLGGTFRATTRGVATNALALGVFGSSAIMLPLSQLLPIGGAGCTLRVTLDAVGFAPVWNGEAAIELSLPSAPALLGASFVQQTLVLETAAGSASALLAGPGTQLTVGAW